MIFLIFMAIMLKTDIFCGESGVRKMMDDIKGFIEFMSSERMASKNTIVSYQRDLVKLTEYLSGIGIVDTGKVTKTSLNSYILHLEREGKASTTISRALASAKAFFHYEFRQGKIRRDPAEFLKAPKIEKKAPSILSVEKVNTLISQPDGNTPKEHRDKAMLELLYATGMRVSELIMLKLSDVNTSVGFVTCRAENKERTIPFDKKAKGILLDYINNYRKELLKGKDSDWLFVNCNGGMMSRQGFWKIIKGYGEKAGIKDAITPHTLRHSFAAHKISGGADIHVVQSMMGHSDMATTQMYMSYTSDKDDAYSI